MPRFLLPPLILILLCAPAFAQQGAVTRQASETDAAFVKEITHQDLVQDGHDQLGRTSSLVSGKEALVAFTERPSEDGANDFELNVFVKNSGQSYQILKSVTACEIEGGSPSLRSFFYVSLSKNGTLVIGVICGWDATHAAADCQLSDDVRFFKIKGGELQALPMEKYTALFYRQVEPTKDAGFTCTVARVNSAQDVKRLLRENNFVRK